MNRTTKRIGALATATTAVMGAGIAYAAWTATGTGSGAAAATNMAVTVSAATAPTADLFPNGSAGALVVKVTNPNSGVIQVSGIVANPASTATELEGSGCSNGTPKLSLNSAAISGYLSGLSAAAKQVAASGNTVFTIPGAVSMGGGADNSCQGQSLSYPVQVTAVTP